MATAYPGSLDDFVDSTPEQVLGVLGGVGLSPMLNNLNGAVEAIEAKVGTGASAATANTVLRGTGAGTTGFGQVATGDITDLAVSTGKIANLAVTTGKLDDLSVTTAKLADQDVTTGKIEDLAVTTAKLDDEAVTQAKMTPGTYVPIGSVIAFWSTGAAAPDGWAYCDGSVLSNGASPLNGLTLPNLTDKFVRGVANSNVRATPSNGGANTINIQHSHTVNSHTHTGPAHTHTWGLGGGVCFTNAQVTACPSDWKMIGDTNANFGSGTYDTGSSGTGNTGAATPGTNNALSTTQSVVPVYIGLVYIIRVT